MVKTLETAIHDMPDKYAPYEILTRYELGKRNKEKAMEILNQFIAKIKRGPDFLKAKVFLAGIYYRDRKPDAAMKLVEEVLKENPKDVTGLTLKGDILVSKKDYAGAISEYRTVLGEQPENIPVTLGLARTHILNKEPAIAKDIYKKVLDKNPNVREALLAMGNMALEKKDLNEADKYFSLLLKLAPKSPVPYYKKGIVKRLEKKTAEAESLFEKSLEANVDYTPALIQSLDPLLKKKKLNEAISRVRQQIKKTPGNSDYYILLGKLYTIRKDYSNARKNYEKAFEINPNSQQALFNLGRLEQSRGSLDKALANYQKMRALDPDNPRIALLVAMTFEQKGEHKKARDIYEEILDRNPEVPMAANNLAFYYCEYEPTKKNLARAEKFIAPLLEKFKDVPSLVDTGAWVYYHKGKYEKARDLLLSIDEKARNIPAINYHMGMIYLGLGEKDKAKSYLQSALKDNKDFPGQQKAEKAMEKLLQK
jgi:tetratricopeptide (TPR) repeat protein